MGRARPDRVLALIGELGLETFPTYTEGRNVLELGGKRSTYKGTIPRISPLVLADIRRAQRRFDRLARTRPGRRALGRARTPSASTR